MKPALEVVDVSIRYGEFVAVDQATFSVDAGAFAALVGPSGCGKTSLLRAMAGFESITRGVIRLGDSLVAGNGKHVPPEKREIGMMFQEGALFPHLNVIENIAFGATRSRAQAMLALVGLETLATRYPHELSGGQQQRVALARALAPSPRVILLDEPFDGLDASLRVRIRDEVREILRKTGTTAILVTHDQEEALSIADQVSVMHRGRILQTGTPREIYEAPARVEVAEIVGDAKLIDAAISNGTIATPLGTLATDREEGTCTVRMRGEDLHLVDSEGVEGTVVATHFFGHDAVSDVRLADGSIVSVRTQHAPSSVGDRVRVALRARSLRVFLPGGEAVDASVQRLSAVG